jgi:hypothetical protein
MHADRCARLHQTTLRPIRPLCSIRRSQGRGVSRPIVLLACQLLGPTVPCPYISFVRSRRPAATECASECHLRSPGGNIGGCRSPGPRNTRVVVRILSGDALSCMRPANPVDLLAKPRVTGRCEARYAVLTERRRRCVRPSPILQYSGAVIRLGGPCVVGVVQVASTPRIRPRGLQRYGGSEAHGASRAHPTSSWHWSRML